MDEHPNMVLFPSIHKPHSACVSETPCVIINLSSEDIHIAKDFLMETD